MNLAHTLIYEQRHKNMITPWEIMYDSDRNISITVEAEPNKIYGDSAFFNFYNHIFPEKATKVAMICFKIPRYIVHYNNNNLNTWMLNDNEKRMLMEFLSKKIPSKLGGPNDSTVYKELIKYYNELTCSRNMSYIYSSVASNNVPYDTPMPDYMQLQAYDDKENYNWNSSGELELSDIYNINEYNYYEFDDEFCYL